MGTKKSELKDGCFAKAKDNEPIFVLRAQDEIAPYIVTKWAETYRIICKINKCWGKNQKAKFNAAMKTSEAMYNWEEKKIPD